MAGVVISTCLSIYARPADFPLKRTEILTLAILLIISSLFGARVLYLLLNSRTVKFEPQSLFSFQGGFAYFGALAFSILTLFAYSVAKRISFLSLADYCMPFLVLGQAVVRVGCLMAGCCYGKPTSILFGMVFKPVDGLLRHPTQAYEALLLVLIYAAGRFIYEAKRRAAGFTFFITLILYGIGRFFIEYFRTDSQVIFLGLTVAQIACLWLVLIGLTYFPIYIIINIICSKRR
jgi:phosphatidylglycerol:prolipoprotein diacylglycerol transferase